MAKLKMMGNNKTKNGIEKLKNVAEMLHKSLSLGKKRNSLGHHDSTNVNVPQDVKEDHFAVVADQCGEEPRRFVVPLTYLTHPRFVMLLEQAAEEYGFDRKGALTIPCRPSELENILADQHGHEGDSDSNNAANLTWGSSKLLKQHI